MNKNEIQKILVISLSNIGDVILTTPVISLLRERFPSSFIKVFVGPKAISIFDQCKTVNEIIPFNKRASWFEHLRLVLSLRKEKFDLVVDLRNTVIPLLIGARRRTSIFVDQSSVSMRQKHLNRIHSLIPAASYENHFDFFSTNERNSVFQKLEQISPTRLEDFIMLAPGAGSELKRWTISGFAQTAEHFVQSGRTVVLVGDSSEQNLGKQLAEKVSKPVVNLIGLITFRELAALINEAALVIANDSATMHLANELGRPCVSIFGPTNERKYGQSGENRKLVRLHLECTPCERAQCYLEQRKCLDDLSADSVIGAAEELLVHASH